MTEPLSPLSQERALRVSLERRVAALELELSDERALRRGLEAVLAELNSAQRAMVPRIAERERGRSSRGDFSFSWSPEYAARRNHVVFSEPAGPAIGGAGATQAARGGHGGHGDDGDYAEATPERFLAVAHMSDSWYAFGGTVIWPVRSGLHSFEVEVRPANAGAGAWNAFVGLVPASFRAWESECTVGLGCPGWSVRISDWRRCKSLRGEWGAPSSYELDTSSTAAAASSPNTSARRGARGGAATAAASGSRKSRNGATEADILENDAYALPDGEAGFDRSAYIAHTSAEDETTEHDGFAAAAANGVDDHGDDYDDYDADAPFDVAFDDAIGLTALGGGSGSGGASPSNGGTSSSHTSSSTAPCTRVGVLIDTNRGTVRFSRDGVWYPVAFTGVTCDVRPAVSLFDGASATLRFNLQMRSRNAATSLARLPASARAAAIVSNSKQ